MGAEHLLRQARLERGLTLDEIVARTRLGRVWAEKIDEGRFAELPPGVYARGYLRAFAGAVGVDATVVLSQLSGCLPEPDDPLPLLRELAKERTPPTLSAYIVEHLERASKNGLGRTVVRHTAAALDAVLLLSLNAIVALAVARVCDVNLRTLFNAAGGAFAPIALVTAASYFLLLAGIGGRTLGEWLCGEPPASAPAPLDLRTILRRAWNGR